MQDSEKQLDDWITRPPSAPELTPFAAELDVAATLKRLGQLTVPADLSARLEARLQERISTLSPLPVRSAPRVNDRKRILPHWAYGVGSAAAIVLLVFTLLFAGSKSLPGDPLYGLKLWQQQVAYAAAGNQSDASSVALTQLHQALADFETTHYLTAPGDRYQSRTRQRCDVDRYQSTRGRCAWRRLSPKRT